MKYLIIIIMLLWPAELWAEDICLQVKGDISEIGLPGVQYWTIPCPDAKLNCYWEVRSIIISKAKEFLFGNPGRRMRWIVINR